MAPFLVEGTTDRVVFNLWLKPYRAPQLDPDMTVMMDNAAFHQPPATAAIIKAAHCHLLYLPPDRPDLNPIEHHFAKLKRRRSLYPETPLDVIGKPYQ